MSTDRIASILSPHLTNLGILSKLQPGNIIEIDCEGQWSITASTPIASGLTSLSRKIAALATEHRAAVGRRDLFFNAAKKLFLNVFAICDSLRRWEIVVRASNAEPGMKQALVNAFNTTEKEEIESILNIYQNVVSACQDANQGLNVLQSAPPYNNDHRFWKCVEQEIDLDMRSFLRRTWTAVGDFQDRVFPNHFRSKDDIVLRSLTLYSSPKSRAVNPQPVVDPQTPSKTTAKNAVNSVVPTMSSLWLGPAASTSRSASLIMNSDLGKAEKEAENKADVKTQNSAALNIMTKTTQPAQSTQSTQVHQSTTGKAKKTLVSEAPAGS